MSYKYLGSISDIKGNKLILDDDIEIRNLENIPFQIKDFVFEGEKGFYFGLIPNKNEDVMEEINNFPKCNRVINNKIYEKSLKYTRNNKNYSRVSDENLLSSYFNLISWKDLSKDAKGGDFYYQLEENVQQEKCKIFLEQWRKYHLFRMFYLLGFNETQTKIIIEDYAVCGKSVDIEEVFMDLQKYPSKILYLSKEIDTLVVENFRKRLKHPKFQPEVEKIKKRLFYSDSSYLNLSKNNIKNLGEEKNRIAVHGLKIFDNDTKISHISTYKREEVISRYIIDKIKKCNLNWNTSLKIRDSILTEEQINAVSMAFSNPLSIITGGPGTGKTKIIHNIIREAKERGIRYHVAAFTGKAVGRVIESAYPDHIEASTIDMMITKGSSFYRFNLLIIEEVSMVSLGLIYRLFNKFNPISYKIVLVGDINQIPPIEKGNFFSSVYYCSHIPKVCLEKNFRVDQDYGGDIVRNSNLLVNSHRSLTKPPELDIKSKSFNIVKGGTKDIRNILSLFNESGEDISQIAVLTPYNRDVIEINRIFKSIIYKEEVDLWNIGDKIMITKNSSSQNLANGDLGRILSTEDKDNLMISLDKDPDKQEISVPRDIITHAYAFTINKSQGSEYDIIILYIPNNVNNSHFLNLNLIYTAITRAKKMVWIITESLEQFFEGCNKKISPPKDVVSYLISSKYPEPQQEEDFYSDDYDEFDYEANYDYDF